MDNIRIEDIVERIFSNPELTEEDKKRLLVILARRGKLAEGFYFHDAANDPEAVEIWYANVDQSGTIDRGNTGWNDPNIVASKYLEEKQKQAQK